MARAIVQFENLMVHNSISAEKLVRCVSTHVVRGDHPSSPAAEEEASGADTIATVAIDRGNRAN
jgi:hypothetical protein